MLAVKIVGCKNFKTSVPTVSTILFHKTTNSSVHNIMYTVAQSWSDKRRFSFRSNNFEWDAITTVAFNKLSSKFDTELQISFFVSYAKYKKFWSWKVYGYFTKVILWELAEGNPWRFFYLEFCKKKSKRNDEEISSWILVGSSGEIFERIYERIFEDTRGEIKGDFVKMFSVGEFGLSVFDYQELKRLRFVSVRAVSILYR